MGKIISIFNQKGGVGKTTTVVNLSAALAKKKEKILVVDLDPQANTTSAIFEDREENIYDLLVDGKAISYGTRIKNIDIVPSSNELAGAEIELSDRENWQFLLRDILEDMKENYDYIILDAPPSLGVLSIIALTSSNSIIIPVQAEYYALEGVGQLMNTITMVKENFNQNLEIEGVLLCMYDARTKLASNVKKEVENFFGDLVYSTNIPRNIRLAEAPSFGMNIFEYDKFSRGARAYSKLAKEFLNRNR